MRVRFEVAPFADWTEVTVSLVTFVFADGEAGTRSFSVQTLLLAVQTLILGIPETYILGTLGACDFGLEHQSYMILHKFAA